MNQKIIYIYWKHLFEQILLITKIIGSQQFDNEITQHVKTFWSKYNLTFGFQIEHKPEHTGSKLFFLKKAHYSIKTFKDGTIYKFRGLNEETNKNNLYYKLANYFFLESEKKWCITEDDLHFEDERLSTCKDYLKSLHSTEGVIQPASIIKTKSIFKLNSDDLVVNTYKQHKNRSEKDYAIMLLTKDPADVFRKRFKDHKNRLKK